jgi:hypothetical protein
LDTITRKLTSKTFSGTINHQPGSVIEGEPCLCYGFLAAAPGHPFLAKAIETVANQVHNRFTEVDIDETFCPSQELYVLHAARDLFTAGPCLLGTTINRFLGRDPQTSFRDGEIDGKALGIPGRTVILLSHPNDMGATRFRDVKRNMIFAATPYLLECYERQGKEQKKAKKRYSQITLDHQIYGVEGVYVDRNISNEVIRFELVSAFKNDKMYF